MLTFDETDHYASTGYWTNIYSDIVYDGEDGGAGSMPRDIYDDDPEYLKRSALHSEVIPLFCHYLELEEVEHQLARLGAGPKDPRMAAVSKAKNRLIVDLMHVHWLTLRGS